MWQQCCLWSPVLTRNQWSLWSVKEFQCRLWLQWGTKKCSGRLVSKSRHRLPFVCTHTLLLQARTYYSHTVMAEGLKKDLRCKSRYKPLCTLLQIRVGWFRGGGHKVGPGKSILCQHPPTKPLLNSSHHQLQANHTTLCFLDHLKTAKFHTTAIPS